MIDRLEQEEQVFVGQQIGVEPSGKTSEPAAPIDQGSHLPLLPATVESAFTDEIRESARSEGFKALIGRLMDGSEPLSRPLTNHEPKKFNPAHVQIVMLRVAGWRPHEIADLTGYDRFYVCVVLRHPYAKRLIQELLPSSVTAALDMQETLESYSKSIVHRLGNIALTTQDEQVAARVGFGILDRAGYTPVRQVVAQHEHRLRGGHEELGRIATALEKSQRVRELKPEFTIASRTVKSGPDQLSPDEPVAEVPPSDGVPASQPEDEEVAA